MIKYWIYDGVPIKRDLPEQEMAAFERNQDHLVGKIVTKAQYDVALKKYNNREARRRRLDGYRDIRIIKGIMDQAIKDQADGKEMVQTMVEAIELYQQINDDNPVEE